MTDKLLPSVLTRPRGEPEPTVEIPLSELSHQQVSQITLQVVLDIQETLEDVDDVAALKAEIARATAHINANTARLRLMAAELNKEGAR